MISKLLLIQGVIVLVAGVLIHYSPQTVLSLSHKDASHVTKDTIAVLKGWGSCMIGLALVCFQIQSLSRDTAKKLVCRSMLVVWLLLAYGQYKMIMHQTTNFSNYVGFLLLLGEIGLACGNAFYGLVYQEQSALDKKQ